MFSINTLNVLFIEIDLQFVVLLKLFMEFSYQCYNRLKMKQIRHSSNARTCVLLCNIKHILCTGGLVARLCVQKLSTTVMLRAERFHYEILTKKKQSILIFFESIAILSFQRNFQ